MCILWGKKKDLSYGGGGLLKLCINQKACFRLVAQESIKKQLYTHFYSFPLKRALTSLEGMQVQAALEVWRQNWQTSTLDGPPLPKVAFYLESKNKKTRAKRCCNFGQRTWFLNWQRRKCLWTFSYWSSYSFVPYPCLVCYLKPFRRAGRWSGHLKESWAAVLSPFPHKNARK